MPFVSQQSLNFSPVPIKPDKLSLFLFLFVFRENQFPLLPDKLQLQ